MAKIDDPEVAAAFDAHPPKLRRKLLALRKLVLDTAKRSEEVGALEETLKWGQPAYLTPETRSGSTLRLGLARDGRPAVFVHCQTTILEGVSHAFPTAFDYDGRRAARFDAEALPREPLRHLIRAALTYHLNKRR